MAQGWTTASAIPCYAEPFGEGSGFASVAGVENTITDPEWTDLLAAAGAKPCTQCGKVASIPTQDLNVQAHSQRPVWVCFECGHHDAAVDVR